jgi:hypothetical protein
MGVFEEFDLTSYTFLQLDSGAGGNKVVREWDTDGIVKIRDGMVEVGNVESYSSATSVHIRPDESFVAEVGGSDALVGNGIRIAGVNYRIIAKTDGEDFDTGELEFYRAVLKREDIWASESPLPLT